jgi:hypothetical protein
MNWPFDKPCHPRPKTFLPVNDQGWPITGESPRLAPCRLDLFEDRAVGMAGDKIGWRPVVGEFTLFVVDVDDPATASLTRLIPVTGRQTTLPRRSPAGWPDA